MSMLKKLKGAKLSRGYNKVVGSRLSMLLCVDGEFLHSREESRAIHSQLRRSSIGTIHATVAPAPLSLQSRNAASAYVRHLRAR